MTAPPLIKRCGQAAPVLQHHRDGMYRLWSYPWHIGQGDEPTVCIRSGLDARYQTCADAMIGVIGNDDIQAFGIQQVLKPEIIGLNNSARVPDTLIQMARRCDQTVV